MLIAPHRHFWPGILKFSRTKSSNMKIPCRKDDMKQACFLFAMQYSHTASVDDCNRNINCSNVRNGCTGWIRHKCRNYQPICVQFYSRGLTTSAPSAEIDKCIETTKDNHRDGMYATDTNFEDHYEEIVRKDGHELNSYGRHKAQHIPVMAKEVLQILQPKNGQIIVDMTFGAGGHAKDILKAAPDVHYIASDRDPFANNIALKLATETSEGRITPILSRFSELPTHLHQHGIKPGTVDIFLFDLGCSSMQFDMSERGFSLARDGPLDMRMDGDRFPDNPTAADVVNSLSPLDLAHILKKYGEERNALQIAHALVEAKYAFGNFTRTKQLADVILSVFKSGAFRQDKLSNHAHVATKSFQAIRIFVNNELNEIHNGLEVARHYLKPRGICVVISFHSLEDRIVKRHFLDIDIDEASNLSIHHHFRNSNVSFDIQRVQEEYMSMSWKPVSRKVMEPSQDECLNNPRARSAKLRAAFKL